VVVRGGEGDSLFTELTVEPNAAVAFATSDTEFLYDVGLVIYRLYKDGWVYSRCFLHASSMICGSTKYCG